MPRAQTKRRLDSPASVSTAWSGISTGVGRVARGRPPLATTPQITVDELEAQLREIPRLQVVDVRRPAEFGAGHVPGATSLPLDRLVRDRAGLDPARPTAVVCAGGYRSAAGASLLERLGFSDLRNVVGGTSAWVEAGYPVDKVGAKA